MPIRTLIAALTILILCSGIVAYDILRHPPSAPQVPPSAPKEEVAAAAPAAQLEEKSSALETPSDVILDLFQPTEAALQRQHSAREISDQIENAMVICYTLVRCNLMSQREYGETFNALIAYAVMMKLAPDNAAAEAKVRQLASSASASYTMVYSHATCNGTELPAKAVALHSWRSAILSSSEPSP